MATPELNYTTLPRKIWADWENGLLSTPERNLLFVLRAKGNPYGYCSVDMNSLAVESFNSSVDKSYINKLLLSLRSKKYIWYKNRKGRRGSFQVHLDLWLIKDGTLCTLDKYFNQSLGKSLDTSTVGLQTDVRPINEPLSQKSMQARESINLMLNGKNH